MNMWLTYSNLQLSKVMNLDGSAWKIRKLWEKILKDTILLLFVVANLKLIAQYHLHLHLHLHQIGYLF